MIKNAILGMWYVAGFVHLCRQIGFDPRAMSLLLCPAAIIGYFIMLWRWRALALRYNSYIEGTINLLGLMSLMLSTPLIAADSASAEVLGCSGRCSTPEVMWPALFHATLPLMLQTNIVFDKMTLLVHLLLPVGLVLTMVLSPNLEFQLPPLVASVMFVVVSLWNKLTHTFAVRRLYLAEQLARKASEVRMLEAARDADSVLHHSFKNCMADAWGLIDIFLQRLEGRESLLCQALARLQWGINWSKQRSLITRLMAGNYVPMLKPVGLQCFMDTLVQGRSVRQLPCGEEVVSLDEAVCALVLENALSNATRHGRASDPDVCLSAELRPLSEDPGETLQEVVFRVTNYADPSNPRITDDFVRRCLCGERPHSAAPNGVSEGLGLQHIFMAATAVGMQVSLVQEADLVMFTLTTKAQVVGQGPARDLSASPAPLAVPTGLTFCCIDDNAIARLLVTSAIEKGFPQSTVWQYGERLEDVADFTEAVAAGADVAILDQNLEFESQTVLGSDLVSELIANGYPGLLCIRSANGSESDQALYRASGAHCFLDKGLAPAEMVQRVTSAYWSNEVCTAEARSSSELLQAEGAGASRERQERYKAPVHRARRCSKAVQRRTSDTLPGLVSHRSSSSSICMEQPAVPAPAPSASGRTTGTNSTGSG